MDLNDGTLHCDRPPRYRPYQAVQQLLRHLRDCWVSLALTDIVYKALAFAVLTPIVTVAFRIFVAFSGQRVWTDGDILLFFINPVGWLCFVVVGAVGLAILALEQAALLHILGRTGAAGPNRAIEALRFTLSRSYSVLLLMARIAALTLLASLPFWLVLGIIHRTLLNEHNIYFYLAKTPPVFWWAVTCTALTLGGLAIVSLRLLSGWFFALPLMLFEGLDVAAALQISRATAQGRRIGLVAWLAGWAWMMSLISALGTAAGGMLGQLVIPSATSSLPLLLFAVGAVAIVCGLISLAVNLLSTTSFASLLFTLYERLRCVRPRPEVHAPASAQARRFIGFELTWTRLVLGVGAGVVFAMIVGIVMVDTMRWEDKTEITAHRGASACAPENTMAAVEAAIQQGADWVEIDVQETADGHVVVFHDSDLRRVAGMGLKIGEATLEELQSLDIGSWFSPEFKDERVPTLAQVLEACRGRAGVNIELKDYGYNRRLEERVIELVEAHDMETDIVVMSLKQEAIQKMKKLRPSWRVGLLIGASIGDLPRVQADFLAVSAGIATRRFIRTTQRRDKHVHVWIINDAVMMSTMIGRGAGNLITDEPARARAVLKERAELGIHERLLLGVVDLLGIPPKYSQQ